MKRKIPYTIQYNDEFHCKICGYMTLSEKDSRKHQKYKMHY